MCVYLYMTGCICEEDLWVCVGGGGDDVVEVIGGKDKVGGLGR